METQRLLHGRSHADKEEATIWEKGVFHVADKYNQNTQLTPKVKKTVQ